VVCLAPKKPTPKEIQEPNAVVARADCVSTQLREEPKNLSKFNGVVLFEGDGITVLIKDHHDSGVEYWLVQEGRKRGWINAEYVTMD